MPSQTLEVHATGSSFRQGHPERTGSDATFATNTPGRPGDYLGRDSSRAVLAGPRLEPMPPQLA